MVKTLQSQLQETSHQLQDVLSTFSEDEINIVPFEGSWTAGQVGEHIYKSAAAICHALQGRTGKTQRSPDEKMQPIADIFLNFDTKFESPEFIRPSDIPHQQKLLLRCLKQIMDDIGRIISKEDMTATCLEFELPGMGLLTRMELTGFIITHTQRHIHQLKNIKKEVV